MKLRRRPAEAATGAGGAPAVVEAYPSPDGGANIYAPAQLETRAADCYLIEREDWRYLVRLLARPPGVSTDISGPRPVRQTVYVCAAAAWDLLRPYPG